MSKVPLDKYNDISENDLSIFDKKYYSFTINVSTKKYLFKKMWSKYSPEEQETIIKNVLKDSKEKLQLPEYDYYFELTKQGMVHLHGCLYTSHIGMLMLQTEVHNVLGLPKIHPDIVFKFEETVSDISHWRNYMNKTNPSYVSSNDAEDIDFID